jgi:holo-ACP synthase
MMEGIEISLRQLLEARDKRAERQKKLIEKYDSPIITFTVNMPGSRKKTPVSERVFKEGYCELVNSFSGKGVSLVYRETHDFITGSEAYIVASADEKDLKEFVLQIENLHPLGRLFDFDVIGRNGTPVSREELGYPRRQCLLCENDGHVCTRSRSHPMEELIGVVHSIAETYFGTVNRI